MRAVRTALALTMLLLPAAAVRAQDAPDTPEKAAEKVLAAIRSGDAAALKKLAAVSNPDPWLVGEELCRRGEGDAAVALAKAAPERERGPLLAYLTERRRRPPSSKAWKAFATALRAVLAGKPREALRALEVCEPGEGTVLAFRVRTVLGLAYQQLGRSEESLAALREAAGTARSMCWLKAAAEILREAASTAEGCADYRQALDIWRECLAVEEAREDLSGQSECLASIGRVRSYCGDLRGAVAFIERARAMAESIGDEEMLAEALGGLGDLHYYRGSFKRALELFTESLRLFRETSNADGVARTLARIGNVHYRSSRHRLALEHLEQARAAFESLKDPRNAAACLLTIGAARLALGETARALAEMEQAAQIFEGLGDRGQAAMAKGNVASILYRLGSSDRALALLAEAVATLREVGLQHQAAGLLGNLGTILRAEGRFAEAQERLEEALALKEKVGDRAGTLTVRMNLALVLVRRGEVERARSLLAECAAEARRLRARGVEALALGNLGVLETDAGNPDAAMPALRRALELAEETGEKFAQTRALEGLARASLRSRDPRRALGYARRAVDVLAAQVGGVGFREGRAALEPWIDLYQTGVVAGLVLGRPAEVAFFIESIRAGILRETLDGRGSLRSVLLREDLLAEDRAARAAEARAAMAHRRALASGNRAGIQAARGELDAAREQVEEVVRKARRQALPAADLLYPRAWELDEIRARLRPGEILVLYALLLKDAFAVVAGRESAKVVRLGETNAILEACSGLRPAGLSGGRGLELPERTDEAPEGLELRVSRLRELVLDPLDLDRKTTRLLMSPDGVLGFVPFALLRPEMEIAYVPSGSVYGIVRESAGGRGNGVLALGDPWYNTKEAASPEGLIARGWDLTRLPASREEAEAVGDELLLGKTASETALRAALEKRPRWRAVHLACHGLIDPEHPLRSSLALVGDDRNDGFLTVGDVLRMRFDADLVVLSACETGRGEVLRTEGITGPMRAFMAAGAPRVLCSLWKVDDRATKALMLRFYELWNPKKGVGISATSALKKAQEHVRSQGRWRHPYFWAAWVLWGLPD